MKLGYLHLLLVLLPVVLLYLLMVYKITDTREKVFISIIFAGMYFYGGVGASSKEVPMQYTWYFLIFMAVFVLFYRLKIPFSHLVSNGMSSFYKKDGLTFLDNNSQTNLVIGAYLFIQLLTMVYPEFELDKLVAPPAPNVIDALRESIDKTQEVDFVSKLLFYFKLLFLPFYYLSLSKFRTKPLLFFIFLFIPIYIEYCASGYVGRGVLLMNLALWFVVTFAYNKRIRVSLTVATVVLIPFLLTG